MTTTNEPTQVGTLFMLTMEHMAALRANRVELIRERHRVRRSK